MLDHVKLKELMDSRSVNQAELADAAGITEQAISYIARGLRQPSLAVAGYIAKYLGVKIDDIMTEDR